MPIYEFYCSACNTLLNFLSTKVDTRRRPACPHCGHADLERRPARFATLRHGGETTEASPFDGLDEGRMERAMAEMAHELEGIDESEDPRRMGHLMRRFSELSGLDMGPEMEALMERLEAGDDPDEVESEIERLEEAEDPAAGVFRQLGSGPTRRRAPRIDEELHFF